ncbi:hypothetical protein O6H91_01G092900 [Diphasiastrum complanatum]|uniref:Uncharacterized protein n=1 Tax=Diphasiastrum complanatum TaxID=34168 RepID=A0ACC2ETE8_DIPCM|nr:hypothetical protein O6H91_01G092900 [Diphasiastrum complanatum]
MQQSKFLLTHGRERMLLDETINGHRWIPEPPNSNSHLSTSALGGFPFGGALVLLIVCGVVMVFLCFYLWKRIRNHIRLRRNSSERPAAEVNLEVISEEASLDNSVVLEKYENLKPALTLPVLMPGDGFPKYLAWPAVGVQDTPSFD